MDVPATTLAQALAGAPVFAALLALGLRSI